MFGQMLGMAAGARLQIVGTSSGTAHVNGDNTYSYPTGTQDGDRLVLVISDRSNFNPETYYGVPTGWTRLGADNGTGMAFHVYETTVSDGDSSVVINNTGLGIDNSWCMVAMRGHKGNLEHSGVKANGGATTVAFDSLSPTGGAKKRIWICASGHDGGRTVSTWPSDRTLNRTQVDYDSGSADTSSAAQICMEELTSASDTPSTLTISASDTSMSIQVAVW